MNKNQKNIIKTSLEKEGKKKWQPLVETFSRYSYVYDYLYSDTVFVNLVLYIVSHFQRLRSIWTNSVILNNDVTPANTQDTQHACDRVFIYKMCISASLSPFILSLKEMLL